MVKDNQQPYTRKSLLGCQDASATNKFDPLALLNTDRVTEKLTGEELRNSNIRFVKQKSPMGELDLNNKTNDFDLDKIAYLDLTKLREFSKDYGEVDLYLKPENEYTYYIPSTYMEKIVLEIRSKTEYQADDLI